MPKPEPESGSPHPGEDMGRRLQAGLSPAAGAAARAAARCAQAEGTGVWVVGGPVRDVLLGRRAIDLDLVVEGDGPAFARALAAREGGEVKEFTRFWTALVILPGGVKVDVTTARSESYPAPGALPEVAAGDILADMHRRDFTINAMAVRLGPDRAGEFLDPSGGRHDLATGTIRALHEGSFCDDPTRILRAIRFAARYRFTLEPQTSTWLTEAVAGGLLDEVSRQRLRAEIVAILSERDPRHSIAQLQQAGVWAALFSGDWCYPDEVFNPAVDELDRLLDWFADLSTRPVEGRPEAWIVLWLLLMSSTGPETAQMLTVEYHLGRRAIRCALETTRRGETSLRVLREPAATAGDIFWALTDTEPETILALLLRSGSEPGVRDRIAWFENELRTTDPLLTGEDIMALGAREGPVVGAVLRTLLSARLRGEYSTRQGALELAERLLKDMSSTPE